MATLPEVMLVVNCLVCYDSLIYMNKSRLEAFSDGVFSIVITLLILSIKVPTLGSGATDQVLWREIGLLIPAILIYVVTFAVISVLWINHHFLFHTFAKSVNRQLNLLNLLYLMFVAFLPFSADFFGLYIFHQPAAVVYGINIFLISLVSLFMVRYIRKTPSILNRDLETRTIKQSRIRTGISVFFALFGIVATFIYVPLSIFFYAFPVIFNIIPGTLDLSERIFGFTLD